MHMNIIFDNKKKSYSTEFEVTSPDVPGGVTLDVCTDRLPDVCMYGRATRYIRYIRYDRYDRYDLDLLYRYIVYIVYIRYIAYIAYIVVVAVVR